MSDKQEKGTTRVQDLAGTVQKGLVQDVVVPIAQAGAGGLGVGAANAYVNHKLSQQRTRPAPEKKDD
jgi:hypothetical protein